MIAPAYQQLTGLLAVSEAVLQGETYLTGSAEGQLGYTAAQVCHTTYPHQVFIRQNNGIVELIKWGKQNLPLLAIYPKRVEPDTVRGSLGFEVDLGIQFVWMLRAQDYVTRTFSVHFGNAIWIALVTGLVNNIQAVDGSLRSTYHIEELSLGGMDPLPPFKESVCAFEASATMRFKRPPWDTGADSSQVVDLTSIYTDYNEMSDAGAEPLVQSIYEPE